MEDRRIGGVVDPDKNPVQTILDGWNDAETAVDQFERNQ